MHDNPSWSEIIDTFSEISDLSLEERKIALVKLKENSPAIYREVVSLLDEQEDLHPLLENQLVEWNMDDDEVLIGSIVGPYKLISLLGSGGMGSVFLGERVDGEFDQHVAIKLIRPGLYKDHLQEQFKEERQILASLKHASIAQLYDGGTSADGRAYFIMEYVDGLPLDDYLKKHNPPLKKRLDIFQHICEGIAYAHGNLVLHLDIKPGNIFISKEGNIKLLDFGISKKVVDEKSVYLKQENGSIGKFTIGFASPEQLNKGTLSTKSDVYALGTLLYYMVTDRLPYGAMDTDRNSYLDYRKNNSPKAASNSTTIFEKKTLNGDIDAIIDKSIALEPDDRYDSVLALKDDISAYLSDRPISPRKSEKGYLALQFYKRNKASLLIALASFLALLFLVVMYTISLRKERNTAVLEKEKKQEVVDMMVGLFAEASPYATQGKSVTVDTFMLNATSQLLETDDVDPEVKGELLCMLGDVFSSLNNYNMADSLLSITEEIFLSEGVGGYKLASLQRNIASMMYSIGEYEKSRDYSHKALGFYRDNNLAEAAHLYIELGNLEGTVSEYALSDSFYVLAKNIYEEIYTPPHEDLATVYTSLGINKRYMEEYDEAEKYYLTSLDMWRQLVEEPNTEIAYNLNHLASNYYNQQKYEEALKYAEEGLEQRMATLGDEHMETLASASNVSRILSGMEDYEKAIGNYRFIIKGVTNIYGREHPYVFGLTSSMGGAYASMEKWDSSLYYFSTALDIYDDIDEIAEIRKEPTLRGIANTYLKVNEPGAAIPHIEEGILILERNVDKDDMRRGQSLYIYGQCLHRMGNRKFIKILQEAKDIFLLQEEGYESQIAIIDDLLGDL